ncbi:hypothetical protein PCE1_000983 [Barthelona sp. PCE]
MSITPSPMPYIPDSSELVSIRTVAETSFVECGAPRKAEELRRKLGYGIKPSESKREEKWIKRYSNVRLQSLGYELPETNEFEMLTSTLLQSWQERASNVAPNAPVDQRIQDWLNKYLEPVMDKIDGDITLPKSLSLDRYGMARLLSLPKDSDCWKSELVESHRLREQGVLHNPEQDRRTTKDTFHVAEGGLPIADDKIAVPRQVFGNMLARAMHPPKEHAALPYESSIDDLHVSLLLKPSVAPGVPGLVENQNMEIRFFAPGGIVCAADFLESVFGNGGDPFDLNTDSALDVNGWCGCTGFIILAPHLRSVTKKEVGLPHYDDATEKQRSTGFCWTSPEELYFNGTPFKLTARNEEGVICTIIAASYFGYCKKEVKTQLSFAANLSGCVEEEHAGGALVFPSYGLGMDFNLSSFVRKKRIADNDNNFEDVCNLLGEQRVKVMADGYAIDRRFKDIIYLPRGSDFNVEEQSITWKLGGTAKSLKMLENYTYVLPNGYKVRLARHPSWHLVGTGAEGVSIHKAISVSGSGKSEISKPLSDAILMKAFFISNFDQDFDLLYSVVNHDYSKRYKEDNENNDHRGLFHPDRSIGSVIKLLNPNQEYTEEYNRWLKKIPYHVRSLAILLKYLWKDNIPVDDLRHQFSVDMVNSSPGHELKYQNRLVYANYLRCGFDPNNHNWRTFKCRQDFSPGTKIQLEDDISVSVTVPTRHVKIGLPAHFHEEGNNHALAHKHTLNVEARYFQRPDDIRHRGADELAESILSGRNTETYNNLFITNFAPLDLNDAQESWENAMTLCEYTKPVQNMIEALVDSREQILENVFDDSISRKRTSSGVRQPAKHITPSDRYWVCPDRPRIFQGKATKNPRFLQWRSDLHCEKERYICEVGARLYRKVSPADPLFFPIDSTIFGRRNNPRNEADGIPPLAVYNPIHFQDMPEAILDWMACLTGKSPSTTGAGSEGALTKGPFNAIRYAADVNAAFLAAVLGGYDCFTSAAGHIGDNYEVAHDVSLLVPEIWCRLQPHERSAEYLIKNDFLEKVDDIEYRGKLLRSSRLGWRINEKFVNTFLGRIFDTPHLVWNPQILRPETQSWESFALGIENITSAHRRVCQAYIRDGTIDDLLPPLQILCRMGAEDAVEVDGVHMDSDEFRDQFKLDHVIDAEWYRLRLRAQRVRNWQLLVKKLDYICYLLENPMYTLATTEQLHERAMIIFAELSKLNADDYEEDLVGMLGVDVSFCGLTEEELSEYKFNIKDSKNALKNIAPELHKAAAELELF